MKFRHTFVVVSNLNRKIILGRDMLCKYGVRIFYDIFKLKIMGAYVDLERDAYIATIARVNKTIVLKPQTVYLIDGRIKSNPYMNPDGTYQIEVLDRGFITSQPELEITPSLVKLTTNGTFPCQIVNNSNKHLRLKRGCVLGRMVNVEVKEKYRSEIASVDNNVISRDRPTPKEFMEQVIVPEKHRSLVGKMLLDNEDIFAFNDYELLETDLIEADIKTVNCEPINLKPYSIPMSQRQAVSDTIDELLKAKNTPLDLSVVVSDISGC